MCESFTDQSSKRTCNGNEKPKSEKENYRTCGKRHKSVFLCQKVRNRLPTSNILWQIDNHPQWRLIWIPDPKENQNGQKVLHLFNKYTWLKRKMHTITMIKSWVSIPTNSKDSNAKQKRQKGTSEVAEKYTPYCTISQKEENYQKYNL